MRVLLVVLCLALQMEAFAGSCPPEPLKACATADIKMDARLVTDLGDKVDAYQKKLDSYISQAQKSATKIGISLHPRRSPCFNRHTAGEALKAVELSLKNNNGKTCSQLLGAALKRVEELANLDSPEHKTIVSDKAKLDLIDSSAGISEAALNLKLKYLMKKR